MCCCLQERETNPESRSATACFRFRIARLRSMPSPIVKGNSRCYDKARRALQETEQALIEAIDLQREIARIRVPDVQRSGRVDMKEECGAEYLGGYIERSTAHFGSAVQEYGFGNSGETLDGVVAAC